MKKLSLCLTVNLAVVATRRRDEARVGDLLDQFQACDTDELGSRNSGSIASGSVPFDQERDNCLDTELLCQSAERDGQLLGYRSGKEHARSKLRILRQESDKLL